jgi:hypothetical protein
VPYFGVNSTVFDLKSMSVISHFIICHPHILVFFSTF